MQSTRTIRYAVIGQGYISQAAVLPAFSNARSNSKLVAILSDDPIKVEQLGKKHGVERTYSYARPSMAQEIKRPAVNKPELVHASSPSGS